MRVKRVAIAIGACHLVQRTVQPFGKQAAELSLACSRRPVEQNVYPNPPLFQCFGKVAFGNIQRLPHMNEMFATQLSRWTQAERIGKQLKRRALAEKQQRWQVLVAYIQQRT
ncbi:hypothetical protein D3C75_1126370 [compost metagenome]